MPSDLEENIPLADHRNMTFSGSKKEERHDKSGEVSAVGATNPGPFPGMPDRSFLLWEKINDWNRSVFFATANLYLSVIKMLLAKEMPCSLSRTWGHPLRL